MTNWFAYSMVGDTLHIHVGTFGTLTVFGLLVLGLVVTVRHWS